MRAAIKDVKRELHEGPEGAARRERKGDPVNTGALMEASRAVGILGTKAQVAEAAGGAEAGGEAGVRGGRGPGAGAGAGAAAVAGRAGGAGRGGRG